MSFAPLMENNNTANTSATGCSILPSAPYVCIDSRTGIVVRKTTYANRKRLRNWADRKDSDFGAVRFVCRIA